MDHHDEVLAEEDDTNRRILHVHVDGIRHGAVEVVAASSGAVEVVVVAAVVVEDRIAPQPPHHALA